MAEEKKTKEKKMDEKRKGGGLKRLAVLLLFLIMAYLGLHVYFIWQPLGKTNKFNQAVIDTAVAGVKVFPAIQNYDMDDIASRREILAGSRMKASPLPRRLATAIERNEPVTFTEENINVWLRKRLQVKQAGYLEPYVNVRGVWVNLTDGEIEFIIERELPQGMIHVVSLFMKFEPAKNGFTIHRHASHVGQVKMPGGFARLVMPSFSHMAEELSEELKLYKDDSLSSDKALKIHGVKVELGRITLDPRLDSQKEL